VYRGDSGRFHRRPLSPYGYPRSWGRVLLAYRYMPQACLSPLAAAPWHRDHGARGSAGGVWALWVRLGEPIPTHPASASSPHLQISAPLLTHRTCGGPGGRRQRNPSRDDQTGRVTPAASKRGQQTRQQTSPGEAFLHAEGLDASQELGRDEEMGGLGKVRPEAREDRTDGTGVRHRLALSMTTAA
jgi:hypothetical protein